VSGDDDQRHKQLEALQAAAGKKAGAYLYDLKRTKTET
jgi:hypothetical protein